MPTKMPTKVKDTPTELIEFLPGWVADFVDETADELQVPTNAVALLSIGAAAAAVNGGANTCPTGTWAEPVVLYTLALLASGEGKSPVFSRLIDPVIEASMEVCDAKQGDVLDQKARNRMVKKHLRSFETDQMRKVRAGEISLDEAIAAVATEERMMKNAARSSNLLPVRVLTDASPAAVLDAMEANDGRLVVASPEAEALLNFRGGSKEAVLKGFDGETLTQARRTTGEVTIERPVVNMMLAMQPTVLGSLGADMVNRGLMPRFLISYPETMVGRRASRPTLVSPDTIEAYEEGIRGIVEKFASNKIIDIVWEPMATKEIGTWRDEIEPMLAADGDLASVTAWASKVRGAHFVRLAALLAIMNGRTTVGVGDAKDAKAILRLLIADARRAFGAMGASFTNDDLVHLMSIVARVGEGVFSKRDIMRKSNRFMGAPERCADALAKAVEEGMLTVEGRGWQVVV
jgi:replicative DNA helicase